MWKFVAIAVFAVLWAFMASAEVDGKKQKTGCNNTFGHNNSAFNLNDHTLKNYSCYFIIKPETTGVINLLFFDIFLHEKDVLNIYRSLDDAVNGTHPLLEKPILSQNGTLTIITNETELVVYLYGEDQSYSRVLEGLYNRNECSFAIKPETETLYPPTYVENVTAPKECIYRFNEIPHERVIQVFAFEEYSMLQSEVKIEDSTLEQELYSGSPTDFFIAENKNLMTITVKQALNSTDHFKLKVHHVDKACSGKIRFNELSKHLSSPPYELNNGSITAFECRWVVEHNGNGKILGLKFDKLDFGSVFDIVAVNDGKSEFSPPLLQVTKSNKNITQNQVIRGNSTSLWISFKPISYESSVSVNISVHGQGGYFKNSGNIKMIPTTGEDTAFLLEVKDKEVVILNFDESSIKPPATVSVYDGFDTSNLLASLHGQIKYPVISRSSRMMVTGTKFSEQSNHFSASFQGIVPDCSFMNSLAAESYILSENCNTSCLWVIPPQNTSNSVLVVYLQYLSLKEGDSLKIHKLDDNLTELVTLKSSKAQIPHISVPADVGMLVNITQASCKKKEDKIVFIGNPSYIPACGYSITPNGSDFVQLSSPLYPDTYPVFSSCHWNISAAARKVHMVFQNVSLAKNHCIKISQKSGKSVQIIKGNELPEDLFLSGDVVVDFDSSGCNKTEVGGALKSGSGFLLNVTVTDCGRVIDDKPSGSFSTNDFAENAVCIWKVSVPPSAKQDSANIVSYSVEEMDKLENYEFHVYDGSSVRDSEILNNSDTQIWSRTNTLIFVYKRLNTSEKSGNLRIKYESQSCGTFCENKICMHPDWKCNGINECGDFSDERSCGSVPIPPEVTYTGYSATAFWLCIIAMMIIGAILGVTVPICFQRYRDSRYRRFHELES